MGIVRLAGTTALTTILMIVTPTLALAQEAQPVDVKRQPLATAIAELSDETNLRVLAPTELLEGHQSSLVSGPMSPRQALRVMIAGTGLSLRDMDDGSVVVTKSEFQFAEVAQNASEEPFELGTLILRGKQYYGTYFEPVEGYRAEEGSTALRTSTEDLDTPASTTTITREVIEDAGVERLSDIADVVPGFTRDNDFGGTNDTVTARGFGVDFLINGSRLGSAGVKDSYRFQRVEALRGPASALYGGTNGGGGTVNVVTKRPLYEPLRELTFSLNDQDLGGRIELDYSQPVTEDGRIAFRLNAVAEQQDSFRDFVESDAFGIAPALRWDITDRTSFLIEGEYYTRREPFDRGFIVFDGELLNDPSANYSEPDLDDNENTVQSVQGTLQHFFTDTWVITGRIGTEQQTNEGDAYDNRIIAPFSLPAGIIGVNAIPVVEGDTILRNIVTRDQTRTASFADVIVNGEVTTGPITHELTFGFDYQQIENDVFSAGSDRVFLSLAALQNTCLISISNPEYGQCDGLSITETSDLTSEADAITAFVQNRVVFSDSFSALLALGYTDYEQSSRNNDTGAETEISDNKLSARLGLVYRPRDDLSFYGSYSEGLANTAAFARFDPDTDEVLAPPDLEAYEVGVKKEWLDGQLFGAAIVFRQELDGLNYRDPETFDLARALAGGDLELARVDGINRSEGLELEFGGQIDNWQFRAFYAYTDAQIIRGYEPEGTPLQNTPEHQFGLTGKYSWDSGRFDGLSLGANINFVGERRQSNLRQTNAIVNPATGTPVFIDADTIGKNTLPSYTVVDLFGSYNINDRSSVNFRIDNVFDEVYAEGRGLIFDAKPGAPRTFQVSYNVEF